MRTILIPTLLSSLLLSACGDKKADASASAEAKSSSAAASGSGAAGASTSSKAGSTPAAASGPVAPLAEVGKRLNGGMKAFIGGSSLADAFTGWQAEAKDEAKLRESLKAADVASAESMFQEFELVLEKGGKDVYYLRTGVRMSESEVVFVTFDGRDSDGPVSVSTAKLEELTGPAAPFKAAAESLFKHVSGPDCAKLPILSKEQREKIAPEGELREELAKMTETAEKAVPDVCKKIAGLGADKIRVRADDHAYLARKADGTPVGTIKGDFELSGGKVAFGLGGFKSKI